ncbi:MAG: PQQ-binding-like beta-propeller repeat protein [bacterium]|nr:PQQ-binding-like beta-propeller repeat protein [bacterium]
MIRFLAILLVGSTLALPQSGSNASQTGSSDWPTLRHDHARSGRTSARLDATRLVPAWAHQAEQRPRPAWPGPARWDAFAGMAGLKSMRDYDPVYFPVIAGEGVYIASSADDTVTRLDAATGALVWRFVAGGPVRVAPEIAGGRVYFGSDDGAAYCLDADDGALLWSREPQAGTPRVLHDGRLISRWPVRTGVVVEDGVAYFAASMLPWNPSFVCAVDAATGEVGSPVGERPTFVRDLGIGWTMEGGLLANETSLIVPQGRVAPLVFDRATGASRGVLGGGGGSFVLLSGDRVLHGPGNKTGWITDSNSASREVIASYDRGNAIVVGDEASYLLSDRTLAALGRESRGVLWSVPSQAPYALVLAGDVLFAGGPGRVDARATDDGRLVWTSAVEGAAHGLAVANGRLYVATDEGRLHVFAEGDAAVQLDAAVAAEAREKTLSAPPELPRRAPRGVVDQWIFQSDTVAYEQLDGADPRATAFVSNRVEGRPSARVLGAARIEQAGELHALTLDGRGADLEVAANFAGLELPSKAISAEAWVRVDRPIEWGGLVSVAQDNGAYERGWMLGFRQKRFGFAVAGEGGPDQLTWLLADADYELGRWHHVVGTYDGRAQRVYVDGRLAAESEAQSGKLRYPEEAPYHVGAYRDADEYFRVTGALHEAGVYDRGLSAREVKKRFEAKAQAFPEPPAETPQRELATLTAGPILRFVGADVAVVDWETKDAVESVLVHDGVALVAPGKRSKHQLSLTGLTPRAVSSYRIRVGELETRDYECDTHFNFHERAAPRARDPFPTERASELAQIAQRLVDVTALEGGLSIVVGLTDGRFPWELARASGGRVIVVADGVDPRVVRDARTKFVARGVYGTRIAILTDLPPELPRAIADLVVADPEFWSGQVDPPWMAPPETVAPDGGFLFSPLAAPESSFDALPVGEGIASGFHLWRRRSLPGAGAWTHMYGRPDNSAFGGESLGGARRAQDLQLQWIGHPGPRYQSDRQNRKPSPLAANGRLFMQGLGRILAVDAYNGLPLWGVELPELPRFNVPRTSSNWCTDGDGVFFAMGDRAWNIDAGSGLVGQSFTVHAPDEGFEWGYIARRGDSLIGSAVRAGSQFTEFWGSEHWYDKKDGESVRKVCNEMLFSLALDRRLEWKRQEGMIVESTITVTDEHVYFVEARGASAREEARTTGRLGDSMWEDLHLVCLDAETGRVRWQREARPAPGRIAFYLAHSDGMLVMLSSDAGKFSLYAFDAANGRSVWRKQFAWEVDHHGKHLSRPAITAGKVYVRPLVFELETGEPVDTPFPEGHQCGTYTCIDGGLILRAGELCLWDPESGDSTRWSRLRPDCWISSVPALGMLLAPEGGGGCSCGSWMEASMGFLPKER